MPAELTDAQRQETGIGKAVNAAGSFVALAEQIGVKHQPLHRWWKRGWMPIERAKQTHALYPQIPLNDLLDPELVALTSGG